MIINKLYSSGDAAYEALAKKLFLTLRDSAVSCLPFSSPHTHFSHRFGDDLLRNYLVSCREERACRLQDTLLQHVSLTPVVVSLVDMIQPLPEFKFLNACRKFHQGLTEALLCESVDLRKALSCVFQKLNALLLLPSTTKRQTLVAGTVLEHRRLRLDAGLATCALNSIGTRPSPEYLEAVRAVLATEPNHMLLNETDKDATNNVERDFRRYLKYKAPFAWTPRHSDKLAEVQAFLASEAFLQAKDVTRWTKKVHKVVNELAALQPVTSSSSSSPVSS